MRWCCSNKLELNGAGTNSLWHAAAGPPPCPRSGRGSYAETVRWGLAFQKKHILEQKHLSPAHPDLALPCLWSLRVAIAQSRYVNHTTRAAGNHMEIAAVTTHQCLTTASQARRLASHGVAVIVPIGKGADSVEVPNIANCQDAASASRPGAQEIAASVVSTR